MGSKKSKNRMPRVPAAPPAASRAAKNGPPWLFIVAAVGVVAAIGIFTFRSSGGEAPTETAASTAAEQTSIAAQAEQDPSPAEPAAPALAGDAPDRATPEPEAPLALEGLPMPPLPYVPQMVPRPPELIRRAYVFAAQNPGVLGYVPCYCGCENDGHVSNVDCFVGSRAANGAVEAWDTHGMT